MQLRKGNEMFDHIQIKVKDFAVSRKFYSQIYSILGHGTVFEEPGVVAGYGPSTHEMFEIRNANKDVKLTVAVHVAFSCSSREQVVSAYETALNVGGSDNGGPGERPYEEGYYAAFVFDPDGNNIEFVYFSKSHG
jgi:predicted lactoylglutathione lyase